MGSVWKHHHCFNHHYGYHQPHDHHGSHLHHDQVVLSDLPPTYSQLDLASPPPSYGPDLEVFSRIILGKPSKFKKSRSYGHFSYLP